MDNINVMDIKKLSKIQDSLEEMTPDEEYLENFREVAMSLATSAVDVANYQLKNESPILEEIKGDLIEAAKDAVDNKKFYAMDAYSRAIELLNYSEKFKVKNYKGETLYTGWKYLEPFAFWDFESEGGGYGIDPNKGWILEDPDGMAYPKELGGFINEVYDFESSDLEEFKSEITSFADEYLKGKIFPALSDVDTFDFEVGETVSPRDAMFSILNIDENSHGTMAEDVDININDVDW